MVPVSLGEQTGRLVLAEGACRMSNQPPVWKSQARTSRTGGPMPPSSRTGMSGAVSAAWSTPGGHVAAHRS